jgi:hypothetical protein
MHVLFPALEARFNQDDTLRRLAGKLYHGFAGDRFKPALPYVEAHRIGGNDDFDTWDKDVEGYDIQFSVFTKATQPARAAEILHHMTRVFDDAQLESEHFTHVQSKRTNISGPTVIEGVYQGVVSYDFLIERTNLVPVTRFAAST